jgi:hypothetical protein
MAMHITEPLPGEKRARLVFGLDWRAWPAKGAKDGRSRYADDFGASHYVEMKVGDEMIGGFCAPDPAELRRVSLYSGAARIASLERVRAKPAVLVLMQDGQRVHLVHVVRGAVRNDEVVTLEQARKRQTDIAQQCQRAGLHLTLLCSGESIEAGDEPFRPAELLQQKKVGQLRRVPMGVPNAVVVLLLIGFGGFAVKQIYNAFNPPELEVQKGPTWTQTYNEAVRQTFAGDPPLASALAPRLLSSVSTVQTNRAGWQFDQAMCQAHGVCAITYTRMGGSFEDFARAATPAMQPLTFAATGLSLTAGGPAVPKVDAVSPSQQGEWLGEQQLVKLLQTPPQRLSTVPTDLKSFGYVVHIEPAASLLATPPPANEPHGPLIREGKWEIDGYLWQAPLLARLPSSMTLETLSVKLNTSAPEETGKVGIQFVAKGKYYVVQ